METFGSYRVVAKLGEGGMGAVYVAEHELLGKRVAVKVLLPECSRNPEIVNRFFNEARAATLLKHPGVVDVLDAPITLGKAPPKKAAKPPSKKTAPDATQADPTKNSDPAKADPEEGYESEPSSPPESTAAARWNAFVRENRKVIKLPRWDRLEQSFKDKGISAYINSALGPGSRHLFDTWCYEMLEHWVKMEKCKGDLECVLQADMPEPPGSVRK